MQFWITLALLTLVVFILLTVFGAWLLYTWVAALGGFTVARAVRGGHPIDPDDDLRGMR
jgi:hypothetical protein